MPIRASDNDYAHDNRYVCDIATYPRSYDFPNKVHDLYRFVCSREQVDLYMIKALRGKMAINIQYPVGCCGYNGKLLYVSINIASIFEKHYRIALIDDDCAEYMMCEVSADSTSLVLPYCNSADELIISNTVVNMYLCRAVRVIFLDGDCMHAINDTNNKPIIRDILKLYRAKSRRHDTVVKNKRRKL